MVWILTLISVAGVILKIQIGVLLSIRNIQKLTDYLMR